MNMAQELILPTVWAVGTPGDGWVGAWAIEDEEPGSLPELSAGRAELHSREDESDAGPVIGEIAYYRRYTEGMLRRYLRLSMEAGKVPSLIGRPMFRGGRVTRYKVQGFDDVVIFVYDVERCLGRLTERQRTLIERIALQEHVQADVAEMLGMSLRSVNRRYVEAVDALSRVFLAAGLMEPLSGCQGECA